MSKQHNVIVINFHPQECGDNTLTFVDTFDGQVLREISINYYRDWDSHYTDTILGNNTQTFYMRKHPEWGPQDKEFMRTFSDYTEYFPSPGAKKVFSFPQAHYYADILLTKPAMLQSGKYVVTSAEYMGLRPRILRTHDKVNDSIWKITVCDYTESDKAVYHPDEDRFYKELADQGIILPKMTEDEWLYFSVENLISAIAEQLGYKVLNVFTYC